MKTDAGKHLAFSLILICLGAQVANAQRHGRADSVQNYTASQRVPNPILNIDYEGTKTWRYPRLSELLKLNRMTLEVFDPKTKRTDVYAGVLLREVIAPGKRFQVEAFQEGRIFRDKRIALPQDTTTQSDVIVADTVNGKRLGQDHPFSLVARTTDGRSIVVPKLAFIRLADVP